MGKLPELDFAQCAADARLTASLHGFLPFRIVVWMSFPEPLGKLGQRGLGVLLAFGLRGLGQVPGRGHRVRPRESQAHGKRQE